MVATAWDLEIVGDAAPYASAREHLDDHLARVRVLLARTAARNQLWATDSSGRPEDRFVSAAEAHAFVMGEGDGEVEVDDGEGGDLDLDGDVLGLRRATEQLHDVTRRIAARAAATRRAGGALPLDQVCARFGLTADERDLLLIAMAPALDVRFHRAYRHVWADSAKRQTDVGFLLEVAGVDPSARDDLRDLLAPDAPLVLHRLIVLEEAPGWRPRTPLLYRLVDVPGPVVDAVRGGSRPVGELGDRLRACPARDLAGLVLDDAIRQRAASVRDGGAERVVVIGAPGAGKQTLAAAIGADRHDELVVADLRGAGGDGQGAAAGADPCAIALDAVREARLRDAGLILRVDAGEAPAGWPRALGRRLAGDARFVAVCATAQPPWLAELGEVQVLGVPLPTRAQQAALWTRALAEAGGAATVDPAELVAHYGLTAGQIHEAIADARRHLGDDGPLGRRELIAAIQRGLAGRMSSICQRVDARVRWEDMILTEEVGQAVADVVEFACHQQGLLDDWGFRKKLSHGRGLSVLLAGPPGTGKTMIASLVASELGRELYRVDLSAVMSKWIGETEKNLARVFDEAEASQATLLFDEADALFGKRASGKGADGSGRWANVQIDYLLQRIDSYDGVCFLTTNLKGGIDEAFRRRLRFHIDLDLPTADERERIWRAMFPAEVPIDPAVDWTELAAISGLAGGHIKNAALRAAIRARATGGPVTQDLLLDAAEHELVANGRVALSTPRPA